MKAAVALVALTGCPSPPRRHSIVRKVVVSARRRLTARRRDQYRDDMTRRRVHLTGRWPTLAETARVFKLSAATQRRISREVAEVLKEYKEALAAGNGR